MLKQYCEIGKEIEKQIIANIFNWWNNQGPVKIFCVLLGDPEILHLTKNGCGEGE